MYPKDYLYSPEHEWLKVEGDQCTVGITDFAQKELGEVVFVELPDIGSFFDAGDEIGTIESVKAVAELYAPVSGEVIEVNAELEESPELANDEPHGAGWICKMRLGPEADLSQLMDAGAYSQIAQED